MLLSFGGVGIASKSKFKAPASISPTSISIEYGEVGAPLGGTLLPPPPPPPPATAGGTKSADGTDDEAEDILPPGIDVAESDDCVPRPISDGPIPRKGPLPKDLEEALNIIFPGEKKSDDEDAEAKKAKSRGKNIKNMQL